MKHLTLTFAALLLSGSLLFAQEPPKLAFEVASIKPMPPLSSILADIQSGKMNLQALGTKMDGARLDMGAVSLFNLVVAAYKLKPHQVEGPEWMRSQLFEIHARFPEGATKEQLPEMLQSLLVDRFKLVSHRESKEQPVYALIVSKNGPKLKDTVEEAEAKPPAEDSAKSPEKKELLAVDTPDGQVKVKQEGRGMTVSGGKNGNMRISMGQNGAMSMEYSKLTMATFSDLLSQLSDRPVVDKTDLKGNYQISLEIPTSEILNIARRLAPDLGLGPGVGAMGGVGGAASGQGGAAGVAASDPSGGAIFQAVQQLGLKLDSRKMPIDTLIIDKIEKTPTEN